MIDDLNSNLNWEWEDITSQLTLSNVNGTFTYTSLTVKRKKINGVTMFNLITTCTATAGVFAKFKLPDSIINELDLSASTVAGCGTAGTFAYYQNGFLIIHADSAFTSQNIACSVIV